jgi:hypothetical protein
LINNSYGPLINALPLSLADIKSPVRERDDGGIKVEKRAEDEYGFADPAISRPQRTYPGTQIVLHRLRRRLVVLLVYV